jgi:hypothetical protein
LKGNLADLNELKKLYEKYEKLCAELHEKNESDKVFLGTVEILRHAYLGYKYGCKVAEYVFNKYIVTQTRIVHKRKNFDYREEDRYQKEIYRLFNWVCNNYHPNDPKIHPRTFMNIIWKQAVSAAYPRRRRPVQNQNRTEEQIAEANRKREIRKYLKYQEVKFRSDEAKEFILDSRHSENIEDPLTILLRNQEEVIKVKKKKAADKAIEILKEKNYQYYQIVKLKAIDGFTFNKISKILNIPSHNTVNSRYTKAIKILNSIIIDEMKMANINE